MLLHRKNDNRDATSRSLRGTREGGLVSPERQGREGGLVSPERQGREGGCTRSRKSGSTRMRSSPNWIPASKLRPSFRPALKNSRSVWTSSLVTGRRYASRATLDRIFVAQAVSSAPA